MYIYTFAKMYRYTLRFVKTMDFAGNEYYFYVEFTTGLFSFLARVKCEL